MLKVIMMAIYYTVIGLNVSEVTTYDFGPNLGYYVVVEQPSVVERLCGEKIRISTYDYVEKW